jgi:hypothetical protein
MASDDTLFSDQDYADLLAVARAMYPHDALAAGPYERTVQSIVGRASAEPALYHTLLYGVEELRLASRGELCRATASDLQALLREREATPFFTTLRPLVAWCLYDDREVWQFVWYPGASFELGGYLHRGFDDLAWLPDPRIEESDDALPDIGPLAAMERAL